MIREEAIKILKGAIKKPNTKDGYLGQALDMAIQALKQQPKTGHWIEVDIRNCHATLKCSVCDRVIEPTYTFGEYSYEDIKKNYPYCHCGAKMEVEE